MRRARRLSFREARAADTAARALCLLALGSLLLLGCAREPPRKPDREEAVARPTIEEVQERHMADWMRLPGVVGTGIGRCEGEPCIKVFAARMTEEIRQEIPDEVEGYPVRVEVTGPFRPRDPADG